MNKLIPIFVFILFTISACGLMLGQNEHPLILQEHPLVGKIWDVNDSRFVKQDELITVLRESDYILLGETHDNLLHHQYQAWVIESLHEAGNSALVAFEMISGDQGEIIKDKEYSSSEALVDDLNQVKTTWGYGRRYGSIFKRTLKAGYPVYAANLDRSTIMAIARKGDESIPTHLKPYLEKNALTEEQKAELREEIKMSHCGMENPHMTKAMMLTQRVKDASMTHSLVRKAEVDNRILIAGSGHVRADRGVPMYVRGAHENARLSAVALVEVVQELDTVEKFAERWSGGSLPFDYVWFTARVDRPDPCKQFRQHMKMKNKQSESNIEE